MHYCLLLVNAEGMATSHSLVIRQLREFPGAEGVSVHFRPVRSDRLFESAKVAGEIAYRILSGEGIVRAELWVEYEVIGTQVSVTGRSADLLFALALITAKWKKPDGDYPSIAATGVLDAKDTSLYTDEPAAVHSVEHTVAKVAAAVKAMASESQGVIFYPAADTESVETWKAANQIPATIRLLAIRNLEDALTALGIQLEKVYLGNPFRGLEHFDYAHRAIFFGRETETRELIAQLLRREAAGSPGVLVEGASGSGKSSFLRAGVLPALVNPSAQSLEVLEALYRKPIRESVRYAIWRVGLLPRGADLKQIASSIAQCWQAMPELQRAALPLNDTLESLTAFWRERWSTKLRFVWLLDQFEDIVTLDLDDSVINAFGEWLLVMQAHGAWTLVSIRADALPQLKAVPSFRQVFGSNEGQFYLEPIKLSGLESVVKRPAKAAGLTYEISDAGIPLDQVLTEEAYRERENSLPLLQFTLTELYLRRSKNEMEYAAYAIIGGISGSIQHAATAIVESGSAEIKAALPTLFRFLVTVDENGGISRRFADKAEIDVNIGLKELLAKLVAARLCVTDSLDGVAIVSFTHESILRTWPILVDWLREESGLLQARELALRETQLWKNNDESYRWLAAADKLTSLQRLEKSGVKISEDVKSFIATSTLRQRRAEWIRRAVLSLILLLTTFATGAGWVASQKRHEAEYQAAEARKSQARLLTEAAAQRLKDGDVIGAQGIILEVLTNPEFSQGRSATARSVFEEARAADRQLGLLAGHHEDIFAVAYSPDGTRLVTASRDRSVRLWDAATGTELGRFSGHFDTVFSAMFSPDGERIVTASRDRTVRIWDVRKGTQLMNLTGHDGAVYSAVYSQDGRQIVTASKDKSVRVWDSMTGALLRVIGGLNDTVTYATFSPDGKYLIGSLADNSVHIWATQTGAVVRSLLGHRDIVNSVIYSRDGSQILTASFDHTARLWDARTGKQLRVFSGHDSLVLKAIFSPDGARVATASQDQTVRIWDSQTGAQLAQLLGHQKSVNAIAYSPDGTQIATGSGDTTVRIWDSRLGSERLIIAPHGGDAYGVSFSPDGKRIVAALQDRSARVWDTRTREQALVLTGHGDEVISARYSPDGGRIVTASEDDTARIWDANSGVLLRTLSGHSLTVYSAAFSPDGNHVVTASFDKTARIWDAATGSQQSVLAGHDGYVMAASYSPDGRRIATASMDKTVRIWDAKTGTQLSVLTGADDAVVSAAYSPDGTRIIAASLDKTAHVWDAQTGVQLQVLAGHQSAVVSANYSPDAAYILTGATDGTARIWDASTGVQLSVLARHGKGIESAAYSPDGSTIATTSDDETVRLWDGQAPEGIDAQVFWQRAAQFDPLSSLDRDRFGLANETSLGAQKPNDGRCDVATAAYYDPDRLVHSMTNADVVVDVATVACSSELAQSPRPVRLEYQWGRVLAAKGDFPAAARQFTMAVANGYRAAGIDLADLLLNGAARMADAKRAKSLYEQAWEKGVTRAAFSLGKLYEEGAAFPDRPDLSTMPDRATAFDWYERGAAAGDPESVARIAERDALSAIGVSNASKRRALLLDALRHFDRAANLAQRGGWPEDIYRNWRYRRATLARVLARDGMMQQVADVYREANNH